GGAVAADEVFGCGLYDPTGKLPDVAAWLGEEAVLAARRAPVAPVWSRARTRTSAATHGSRDGSGGAPAAGDAAAAAAPARHDAGVDSFVLRFDEPLDWFGFSDGLALLLQVYGGRILRIKGLLEVAGDPQPRVLQCVQHSVYPSSSLPAWPDSAPCNDRRSRLVFIVRSLPRDEVISILGSFTGQVPSVGA
ncbi:MAG TPA: GTP-binding protein, partial [Thauera phenylacetica]|nr:GTP-binding protein [Thauera phenylacetica]